MKMVFSTSYVTYNILIAVIACLLGYTMFMTINYQLDMSHTNKQPRTFKNCRYLVGVTTIVYLLMQGALIEN
jgi:hypothetical protein